jgi:hypothetical protein
MPGKSPGLKSVSSDDVLVCPKIDHRNTLARIFWRARPDSEMLIPHIEGAMALNAGPGTTANPGLGFSNIEHHAIDGRYLFFKKCIMLQQCNRDCPRR